jgi:hypothetical protein
MVTAAVAPQPLNPPTVTSSPDPTTAVTSSTKPTPAGASSQTNGPPMPEKMRSEAKAKMLDKMDAEIARQLGGGPLHQPNHLERVTQVGKITSKLTGAELDAFLKFAEDTGKEFGINFGLKRTDASGTQVALNSGFKPSVDSEAVKTELLTDQQTAAAAKQLAQPPAQESSEEQAPGKGQTGTVSKSASPTIEKLSMKAYEAEVQGDPNPAKKLLIENWDRAANDSKSTDGTLTREQIGKYLALIANRLNGSGSTQQTQGNGR